MAKKLAHISEDHSREQTVYEHLTGTAELAKQFAAAFGAEEDGYLLGLLHDIDFELYPEQHCVKANEMLHELDIDESVIHAVISHGYGICIDVEPELFMEKVLYATDELTGLIGAVALMRPNGISDMEVKSIKKKFKDKKFAAGCSRDVIIRGAEMCGWDLDTLFQKTLDAMRA